MKKMKKLMALVIVAVMMMAMSMTAMAGTITVTNVKKGETYKAYKLLEYTNSGDAFSYYLDKSNDKTSDVKDLLESIGFAFEESADGTRYNLKATTMTADEIVASLKSTSLTASNTLDYQVAEANADGQAIFGGIGTGYWFITTTTGSLCSLASYDAEELIVEKNTVPKVNKTQGTDGISYNTNSIDMSIGETVYYEIVVNDTQWSDTDKDVVLTDTMTGGVAYNSGSLKINGDPVADDADVTDQWKVVVSGKTITITFKAAYLKNLIDNADITITYNATLDKNAEVHSATGNGNSVKLEYSAQNITTTPIYVLTYDFQLFKTDGTNFLDGAGFKLYDAEEDGNQIKIDEIGGVYYYIEGGIEDDEIFVTSASGVNIRGLKPGTYYLEETTTPDGYNTLTKRQSFTITSGQSNAKEVVVVNNSGNILPETGGIGTHIFYIVGAVLVIGAAVVLVTRKRLENE